MLLTTMLSFHRCSSMQGRRGKTEVLAYLCDCDQVIPCGAQSSFMWQTSCESQ